ncbi:amiloride-sensitive sodium channel subunit beta-like [Lytechinus variegatus]|uniref:amiloride-sensitive sodium channel subunit beta-like n=1 Tax=Lytechinus variegatus TaxID=7654 RepID=UPI001BB184F3|nr:amiloride-sensitive sodium channel subunit beta-like [Lytechinus variegatus]XP_041464137.1 amiloride-sensitive sodium channel subunit beta-like [Lytechinus variegatus]
MEAWKANVEKEEESFLKILHSRLETSSAHGLPNIHRSSKPITKLFWLLLFLTGIGVITWQVVTLFQTYFAYGYTVTYEIKFNRSQTFPAITICNMNPVMKSKLEGSDDSFRELFDVNFKPPGPMDMGEPDGGNGPNSGEGGGGEGVGEGEGEGAGGGVDYGGLVNVDLQTTQSSMLDTTDKKDAAESKSDVPDGTSGPTSGQGQSGSSATTFANAPVSADIPSGSSTIVASAGLATPDGNATEAGHQEESTAMTNDSSEYTTEAVETWQDRQTGDFFHKKSDGYLKQQRLVVQLANKTIEERQALGHSLEDMLLDCSWRGFPCSPANFTSIYDPQYGNCYIFNSGQDGNTLTTNRPGPSYGLSMELFVQQDEYMEDLTDVAGFRVIVHHPSNMPFPSDDGIFVSPGLVTAIGVHVLEIERLPDPYGECKEDYDGIEDNIYYQNYNISYSVQTCEQSCYQYAVRNECGCSDPSFPSPLYSNGTFFPCDIDSDVETACLERIERKYFIGSLGCECPAACHDINYLPTISSATWPSDNYERKLFEKMTKSNAEMRKQIRGQTPSDWTRSNMAKVEIYFDEFNYEYIRQDKAYTIPDLLSDIGGQLGLWLGLSVITVFEIFESAWALIAFFCSRGRNRTRPVQTIIPPSSKVAPRSSPPPSYSSHFADDKK